MSDYRAGELSERERRLPQRSADGRTTVAAPPQHPVLRMQRTVGNAAVARMLQRSGEEDELQMKRDTSIQREAEGGEAEEEELQMKRDTSVQREAEGGEAEEEELQMKRDTSIQREAEGGEAEEEELQAKHDTSIQRKAV